MGKKLKAFEKDLNESVEDFNWGKARSAIETGLKDGRSARKLVDQIFEHPGILDKTASRSGSAQSRARYARKLARFLSSICEHDLADDTHRRIEAVELLEIGFQYIYRSLERAIKTTKSPASRIWDTLNFGMEQLAMIYNAWLQPNTGTRNIASPFAIDPVTGKSFHAAGAINANIDTAGLTLLMEAHRSPGLVDNENFIELPSEVAGDAGRFARRNLHLSRAWRTWEELDSKVRYNAGTFVNFDLGDLPDSTLREIRSKTSVSLGYETRVAEDYLYWEVLEDVAKSRYKDRLFKIMMELEGTDCEKRIVHFRAKPKIAPESFVSREELIASLALTEFIGGTNAVWDLSVNKLLLKEWLRGYAVLRVLAEEVSGLGRTALTAQSLFPDYSLDELIDMLEGAGLSNDSAKQFLKMATFSKTRRADLYDRPIVKSQGSRVRLFCPSLLTGDLTRVLFSQLSLVQSDLTDRGFNFEDSVRKLFRDQNLPCLPLKFKGKDGSNYEYDAIVLWEDRVFVFECKSRAALVEDPVSRKYFRTETIRQAQQVNRQILGAQAHLEKIEELFGQELKGKTWIGCVLSLFPFSVPLGIDGVYFYEVSALSRFFAERYIYIEQIQPIDSSITLKHRIAVADLWGKDEPSCEAFLRQLEMPAQLMTTISKFEPGAVCFQCSDRVLVVDPIVVEKEPTIAKSLDGTGTDPDLVDQAMSEFQELVSKLKASGSPDKAKVKLTQLADL